MIDDGDALLGGRSEGEIRAMSNGDKSEPDYDRKRLWAWQALDSVGGELRLAISSLWVDLDELTSRSAVTSQSHPPTIIKPSPPPYRAVHDCESTRVDDFCVPRLQRNKVPQHSVPRRCEGFELIDFADEAGLILL